MLSKLNFWQYFASSLNNFPALKKKLVEKLQMIYYALQYFHFCQPFENTIFAEILNIVAKFQKDSIFRAENFRENFR